jgi:hypothetical protein
LSLIECNPLNNTQVFDKGIKVLQTTTEPEVSETQDTDLVSDNINFCQSTVNLIKYAYGLFKDQKRYRKTPEVIISSGDLLNIVYDTKRSFTDIFKDLIKLGALKEYKNKDKFNTVYLKGTHKKKYSFDNKKLVKLAKLAFRHPLLMTRTPVWLLDIIRDILEGKDVHVVNLTVARYRVMNAHIDAGYLIRKPGTILLTDLGKEAYTYLLEMIELYVKWMVDNGTGNGSVRKRVHTPVKPVKTAAPKIKKEPKIAPVTVNVYKHLLERQYTYIEVLGHGGDYKYEAHYKPLADMLDKTRKGGLGVPRRPAMTRLFQGIPNTRLEHFEVVSQCIFDTHKSILEYLKAIQAKINPDYFLNSTGKRTRTNHG